MSLKGIAYTGVLGLLASAVVGCGGNQQRQSILIDGQVVATSNAQVALYTLQVPGAADVRVEFGTDTNYGLTTSSQSVPEGGGTAKIFVAGMKPNTLYHMRGLVQLSGGGELADSDHTFTTGSLSASLTPKLTTSVASGMTPQSGVELLDLIGLGSPAARVVVSDLSGNVLWAYEPGLGVQPNPVKLLSNGHFLINYSNTGFDGAESVLQEVDLGGTVVWQMTAADLNAALASATCAGCNITVTGTHHDFAELPNGHLLVFAGTQQNVSGTMVLGDVVIDLDQNHKPVWLWNEFDHLDVNRRPMGFPDWTHSNAILYSPDDGNILVSIRHQNWIVKLDYANGAGDGHIIWKLGFQGDFTLFGGVDPTDWFYAQHGMTFTSTNTTGVFSLAIFDNGNDRTFAAGVTCGTAGNPPCFYSTAPILQIDESSLTATFTFHPAAPTFSAFGGNTEVLQNGDVEFCEAAGGPGLAADIYEITPTASPQTVWKMTVTGQFAYRGQRMGSLYPGVQW